MEFRVTIVYKSGASTLIKSYPYGKEDIDKEFKAIDTLIKHFKTGKDCINMEDGPAFNYVTYKNSIFDLREIAAVLVSYDGDDGHETITTRVGGAAENVVPETAPSSYDNILSDEEKKALLDELFSDDYKEIIDDEE